MDGSTSNIKAALLSLPPSIFTALFLLSIIIVYRAIKSNSEKQQLAAFARQHGALPPRSRLPYNWPFAVDVIFKGFRAARQRRLVSYISEYVKDMHSTAEICLLGGKGIVTFEPQNIEALLSTQFEDFHLGTRSWGMHAMIGDGIFTQDGPRWKHSRDILRHRFQRMQYQNLSGFREHVEAMINMIRDAKTVELDLQKDFYRLTLDTTINMILGRPVESFDSGTSALFGSAFDEASRVTGTRVRLGDLYYIYRPQGFTAACKIIRDFTRKFVVDALQLAKNDDDNPDEKPGNSSSSPNSFIEDLYKDNPDVDSIRDQVLNILIAGRDTTAATMSYAVLLLLRHPEKLKKLQEEIQSVIGQDSEVTRTHIQSMSYLQNVLKETLRLYPAAPINSRFCRQTTTLPVGGGPDGQSPVVVEKGMPVAYSVYHMQRREDLYGSNALAFRPERWNEDKLANIGWAYLPFNGGPRVCLGKDFALTLASLGLVRVLQEFPDMKLADIEKTTEPATDRHTLAITMSAANGCKVLLR